ncbi:MAG: hypothetical protein U0Y68_26010 [Blastocatellia bacterium]
MFGFLFFLSLSTNAFLLYYAFTVRAAHLNEEQRAAIEQVILRQAMYAHGRLAAVEIAARSAYSLRLVEAVLASLVAQNQCLSELDVEGRAIYVFPQFDDTSSRQEATEREILLLAKLHGGELTAAQIAVQTMMTVDEAWQWLMVMATQGICAPNTERPDPAARFRFHSLGR